MTEEKVSFMDRALQSIGFKFHWGLDVARASECILDMTERAPSFYGVLVGNLWIGLILNNKKTDATEGGDA